MTDIVLTTREAQALSYIMQGLGDKEVAYRMGISTNTAKVYARTIYMKHKCRNRVALINTVLARRGINLIDLVTNTPATVVGISGSNPIASIIKKHGLPNVEGYRMADRVLAFITQSERYRGDMYEMQEADRQTVLFGLTSAEYLVVWHEMAKHIAKHRGLDWNSAE